MGPSSPVHPDDPDGHRISGVAVVVALILLVATGAGLSVLLYFVTWRAPLAKPDAAAKPSPASTTSAQSPRLPPQETNSPASTDNDQRPANAQAAPQTPAGISDGPAAAPVLTPNAGGATGNAVKPPQKAGPSGFDVTTLSPIEIQAADAGRDAWRRSVRMGGRDYVHAICLRPDDQGLAQIAFKIDARFSRLSGIAGIAEPSSPSPGDADRDRPQAVFRVYGDGNLLWAAEPLAGSGDHRSFQCSVAGVDVLTLVAESQSPANVAGLAWGDLQLFPDSQAESPASARPRRRPS